jgi:hydroxymethylglutaryl-CoA reductase (NADPH)
VELRRWPRKNDPESIKTRQDELRALTQDGEVFSHDLTPFASAQEALTGVAVIPVSVIGPLELELGEYELEEPFGRLVETGRASDRVYVPLAHTEGSLSASLYRGARAVSESGGFKTFVLGDRITRASCFVCGSAEEAVTLSRFLDAHVAEMRRWLAERVEAEPALSKRAKLREV